jgi:hypothetical protein
MLIETNPDRLGDKLLSPQEALLRAFEETDRRLQVYRLTDHEELKDTKARFGYPLSFVELIRRVRKINPALWVEDSINMPGHCGFYRYKRPKQPDDPDKEFLAAFPKEVLPEYSIVLVDKADLPIKEMRGWRTVLLRLIQQKALLLQDVLIAFGDACSISSSRWRQYTQNYRT